MRRGWSALGCCWFVGAGLAISLAVVRTDAAARLQLLRQLPQPRRCAAPAPVRSSSTATCGRSWPRIVSAAMGPTAPRARPICGWIAARSPSSTGPSFPASRTRASWSRGSSAPIPTKVMPPPATHKELKPAEKELLKQWIAAGAEYQPHWSLIAPVRPAPPAVKNEAWVRTPIDRFILAKLEAARTVAGTAGRSLHAGPAAESGPGRLAARAGGSRAVCQRSRRRTLTSNMSTG